MSACISSLGEYSDHIVRDDFVCERCFVFDEVGMRTALNNANDAISRVKAQLAIWDREAEERGPDDRLYTDGVVTMLRRALGSFR